MTFCLWFWSVGMNGVTPSLPFVVFTKHTTSRANGEPSMSCAWATTMRALRRSGVDPFRYLARYFANSDLTVLWIVAEPAGSPPLTGWFG